MTYRPTITLTAAEPPVQTRSPVVCGVEDLWLDLDTERGSILRMSLSYGNAYPHGFWLFLGGVGGCRVRVRAMGLIRGRYMFEAVEWHPGHEPARSAELPTLRLQGPSRGWFQDAS